MIRQNIIFFLILTFITGFIYPILVTIACELVVPFQARGSLVQYSASRQTSQLVGQYFTKPAYFWGRPSVTVERPYNLMGGTSSNLSNKSKAVADAKASNIEMLNSAGYGEITEEMVLASASGLDPHISINSATAQIPRIAKDRSMSKLKIEKLVSSAIERPWLGIFGESRVNILKLNLALDKKSD